MADKSTIEWTDATWNPIRGCSRVSEGCRNCYAERVAIRFSGPGQAYDGLAKITNGHPQWTGKIAFVENHLADPLKWKEPRRIFVNSMSDLFHEGVSDQQITDIFGIMALAHWHTFQILTKRPERMLAYLSHGDHGIIEQYKKIQRGGGIAPKWFWKALDRGGREEKMWQWPLPNVWLGVSVENQKAADERIPLLLSTPAAVRWISAEPLLGPIDLERIAVKLSNPRPDLGDPTHASALFDHAGDTAKLDWVVAGGESGPGARPMHPEWARSLRDQCKAAGVPFFFKQWGEYADLTNEEAGSALHNKSTADEIFTAEGNHLGAGYRNGKESAGMLEPGWKERGGAWMGRVGKKAAGRLLDGVEHNEYPEAANARS